MLFDWLVTGQIVPFNPAASVRGLKHVVKKGKTPVLSVAEAKELIESIPTDTLVGLRDRAIMGVMLYSFARVSAVCGLKVKDFFSQGRRAWFRLHEKGGKYYEVPAHFKVSRTERISSEFTFRNDTERFLTVDRDRHARSAPTRSSLHPGPGPAIVSGDSPHVSPVPVRR